ncbi:hypothetical protein Tco_0489769 [Tanacetum coccineum]
MPTHGFTELHQLDTFYNGLNPSDQDSLNSAAGGNLLERSAQDLSASVKFKVVEEFCVTCAVLILYDSVPATDWGDLKVITTRSGISYDGPPIPPPFLLFLWWWNGNPVVDIGYGATAAYVNILTSDTIQKLREKDDILASKFVEIFKELHFELGFTDALLHMPKFASMFKRTEIGEILNLLIDDPTELELHGNYRSHLEYEFLDGTDKLPVIISKELKDEEKAAFLQVLKSHKRAIGWKISDIKGIDPSFCTHKILMEDDFKPAVQHQRRVNQKIHEVIKKELIKLLDAGLIYPFFDSPWVSLVHCVPKKGGTTVVENEDNKLIPTRLVTGCVFV